MLVIVASMRPQRNAAENIELAPGYKGDTGASMRPQRNAAENNEEDPDHCRRVAASMRPQRNAAENAGHTTHPPSALPRFNEAAA